MKFMKSSLVVKSSSWKIQRLENVRQLPIELAGYNFIAFHITQTFTSDVWGFWQSLIPHHRPRNLGYHLPLLEICAWDYAVQSLAQGWQSKPVHSFHFASWTAKRSFFTWTLLRVNTFAPCQSLSLCHVIWTWIFSILIDGVIHLVIIRKANLRILFQNILSRGLVPGLPMFLCHHFHYLGDPESPDHTEETMKMIWKGKWWNTLFACFPRVSRVNLEVGFLGNIQDVRLNLSLC